MIFISNYSFAAVFIFILLYNALVYFSVKKAILNWCLLLGSTIVLSIIVSLPSIAIIIALASAVFFIGKKLEFHNHKRIILNLSVVTLILLFCLKNYSLANFDWVQRVGLSYILFRLIHFLIDSSRGKIASYNAISFINYIIFFPTFIAGPIDEYNNFNYFIQQKHSSYRVAMIKAGLFKLSLGIVKKFFIVPIIINYAVDFSLWDEGLVWQEGLLLSLFFYSFYILFDFSGYSDIAIGTAYLIGIKTPENFDNPYAAKNLSIFWKKWHMTFSNFLFKYVFKPIVVWLSKQLPNSPRLLVSSMGYLLTFTICGIWHGNTVNFIYWGLWHGVGLIFFKLWDTYVYKKRIIHFKNKIFKSFYRIGAVGLTFLFVSIGWFFFNYQTSSVHLIAKNILKENDPELIVNQVIIDGKDCFELKFIPQSEESEFVDIEYVESINDFVHVYHNIPINDGNVYHFLLSGHSNYLSEIQIREKSNVKTGEWYSTLLNARLVDFNQSDIQADLFGEFIAHEIEPSPIDTLLGVYLMMGQAYIDQDIKVKAQYIDNYGWAIKLNYMPALDYFLDIEYRYKDQDWVRYAEKRDGKYGLLDLHGNESFAGVDRNLKPGDYDLRLRYTDGSKYTNWLTRKVTIPNYVDN